MAYTTTVKKRVLKRVKMGLAPIEHIARLRKIPKQTIYRWLRLYDHFGEVGLENRKPGAKPWQINATFLLHRIPCSGTLHLLVNQQPQGSDAHESN